MAPSQYVKFGETAAVLTGLPTAAGSYFLINARQTGFYRVDYDSGLRTDIVNQLKTDHTKINEESRSSFVDDSFALARRLSIPETSAMDTTLYLYKELFPNPWLAALKHIRYANRILRNYALYTNFRTYVIKQVEPIYNQTSWQVIDMESPLYQIFRGEIVQSACLFGYTACLERARQYYVTYSANPAVNSIPADYLRTVLCVGVNEGQHADWTMVYDQYTSRIASPIREERFAYLYGVACSPDTNWLQKFLDDIVGGVTIASRDQNQALTYLTQNNIGVQLVWNYLDSNWNTVPSSIGKFTALRNVISTFYDAAGLALFDAFVAKYPASTDSTAQQYIQDRLIIQQNIDWITANEQSLATWLGQQVPLGTMKLSAAFAMSPIDHVFANSGSSHAYE
jgi:aminopeptidase N